MGLAILTSANKTERLQRAPGTNVQESDSDNDMEAVETTLTHIGDVIENSNESTESSEQATDNAPIYAAAGQPESERPASGQEDASNTQNKLVDGNDSGSP
jgi:hypothetical protein